MTAGRPSGEVRVIAGYERLPPGGEARWPMLFCARHSSARRGPGGSPAGSPQTPPSRDGHRMSGGFCGVAEAAIRAPEVPLCVVPAKAAVVVLARRSVPARGHMMAVADATELVAGRPSVRLRPSYGGRARRVGQYFRLLPLTLTQERPAESVP